MIVKVSTRGIRASNVQGFTAELTAMGVSHTVDQDGVHVTLTSNFKQDDLEYLCQSYRLPKPATTHALAPAFAWE